MRLSKAHFLSLSVRVFFSVCLIAIFSSNARALNVAEPPDFPSDADGPSYVLDVGNNDFSGYVNSQFYDSKDAFKVVVQPGRKIAQIQVTGAALLGSNTLPLYAGTYIFVASNFGQSQAWRFVFVVTAAPDPIPDYDITTTGGQIIVTHLVSDAAALSASEPAANTIRFAAPGRTFSIDGAPPVPGDSGPLSLGGITSVLLRERTGSQTIDFGDFSRSSMPSLTITGGTADNTVNFNGNVTLAPNRHLEVDLQRRTYIPGANSMHVSAGARVVTSGTGKVTIRCARNVSFAPGAWLGTASGEMIIETNENSPFPVGDYVGVLIDGATIDTGSFRGTIFGFGGTAATGSQTGVMVKSGGAIVGTQVFVEGRGGEGSGGQGNRGVSVVGAGSRIAASGYVSVTGYGGGVETGSANSGVAVLDGGVIGGPTNLAPIYVDGWNGAGTAGNHSIEVAGPGSAITSASDSVYLNTFLRWHGGFSVSLSDGALISCSGGLGKAEFYVYSLSIDATSAIAANTVWLLPRVSFTDLGGPDVWNTLGLSSAELDRITTEDLLVGGAQITISAPFEHANIGDLSLGDRIVAATPGVDVTLGAGRTVQLYGLACPISGPVAHTDFPVLKVNGQVDLAHTRLLLDGTTYAGSEGQTFTLIENDGTDPIVGSFDNSGGFILIPEGGSVPWPGSPLFNARISYRGGDGNDVVITLVSALKVTSASPYDVGSLPNALAYAATHPGPDVIVFDPDVSGQTIPFAFFTIADPDAVTIDASNLAARPILDGENYPILNVPSGAAVTVRGVNFTRGNYAVWNLGTLTADRCTFTMNSGDEGGAIYNEGTVTLTSCVLTDNVARWGGAIHNRGTLRLTDCSMSGNYVYYYGSAIDNAGSLELTNCALFDNTGEAISTYGSASLTRCTLSGNLDGAIGNGGPLTLTHCTIAGNYRQWPQSDVTSSNSIIVDIRWSLVELFSGRSNRQESLVNPVFSGIDPQLAPLDDYGGPTKTRALLPGSPLRNAATTSTVTNDQRGFPMVGLPDIGAYEAGTFTNYANFIWETLPNAATAPQHASTFDFDGDGVTNLNEWLALTNPTDITSYLRVTQFTRTSPNVTVTFPSVVGRSYTFESSPDLVTWTPIAGAPVPGTGGNLVIQLGPFPGATKLFIKVRTGP